MTAFAANTTEARRSHIGYGLAVAAGRALPGLTVAAAAALVTPSAYGKVALAASSIGLVTVVGDLGFDAASTMVLGRSSDAVELSDLLRVQLRLRLALAATAGFGVAAIASLTHAGGGTLLYILVLLAGIAMSLTAALRVSVRIASPAEEARLLIVERFCAAAIFAGLILVAGAPIAYALSVAIAASLVVVSSARMRGLLGQALGNLARPWRVTLRSVALPAAPFALSATMAYLYWRVDVAILAAFKGAAAAGTYAAGYYPVMALALAPGAVAVLRLRSAPRASSPLDGRSRRDREPEKQ